MSTPDFRPMVQQMTASVRGHTERAVAPLREKVATLEAAVAARPSADFVRAELALVTNGVAPLKEKVAALEADIATRPSADFVRAEITVAKSAIALEVLGAMSKSKDGAAIGVEEIRPIVESVVAGMPVPKDGAPGRDGVDGKSVEPAEVERMVVAAVQERAADADADVEAFALAITQRFTAAALG